jgi:hypothetical protein
MLLWVVQTRLCCFLVRPAAGKELPVSLRRKRVLSKCLKERHRIWLKVGGIVEALGREVELGRSLGGTSA